MNIRLRDTKYPLPMLRYRVYLFTTCIPPYWRLPLSLGTRARYVMGPVQNIHDVMRIGSMASAARDLDFKHRQGKARLRAGVPAVLTTMNGRQVVSLLDLSESGAGLVVEDGWRLNGGVLK